MGLTSLTRKEKLVFFSLVKHPLYSDSQVSKMIDVKRSTVTAIRNRLKRDGFYSSIVIPNLPALGCRLLQITYGNYNPLTPIEERRKSPSYGDDDNHPELIFARSTDTEFIKIFAAEHLYDIRSVRDKIYIDYETHDFIEDIHNILYPLELCNITSIFNYVPLLGKLLGIEIEEADYNNYIFNGTCKSADLTNVEKNILNAIVNNPEANIVELSKLTGKTRSTVSKVSSSLIERKLIQKINLPTLENLGCELMVFIHTQFNPKSSMETRKEEMKNIMKAAGHVFKVSGNIESAGIIVPRNYTEFIALYNEMISLYRDKGYISENPHYLLLPIEKIKYKKLDFGSLTHKLLFNKM